jgi:hypothetical protein
MARFCEQPRTAGTAFNRKVRDFIKRDLLKAGYKVRLDTHSFTGWELIKEPAVEFIAPVRRKVDCISVVRSGSTGGRTLKGRVVPFFRAMQTFEAYDFQRFTVADDHGKAIAILMTRPDMVWAQPIDRPGDHLPHIMVDTKACAQINHWIATNKEIRLRFSVNCRDSKRRRITNVEARGPQGALGLLLSAHYDSFFNTVGAHDNASGSVCLLQLAKRLRSKLAIAPTVCFFDAEEWNKFGAYSYVKRRMNKGTLSRTTLQINIDSVGVPGRLCLLTSPRIEKVIAALVRGLPATCGMEVEIAAAESFPQFDTWPFMREGISVIQIGSRPSTPFKHWHSKGDTLANIDYDFMAKVLEFLEAFVVAVRGTALLNRQDAATAHGEGLLRTSF